MNVKPTVRFSRILYAHAIDSNFVHSIESRVLEVIQWLTPIDYESKHESVSRLRTEGTCSWLFNHDDYIRWSSSTDMLWLKGKRKCDNHMDQKATNRSLKLVAGRVP